MCLALQLLENRTRRYIFPLPNTEKVDWEETVPEKVPIFSLFNESIATNAEQLQAVQQIFAGPNPQAPYIVFGPPGTGKTTTIVEAILQVCLQEYTRILITAGSNSACDTIALKICEVIASSERLQELVKYSNEKKTLPTWRLIRFYSLLYDRKKIDPNLKKYFKCIAAERNDFKSLYNYKIIVATLCGVARMRYYANFCPFTHIFIDEAAASSEAEALMGIAGVKDKDCHVILSGDHKQLGAVIKCDRAKSLGLGQSLMERLLLNKLYEVDTSGNYDRTLQSRLRQNYRSHPEIVGIFNKLYYNCELIPMAPPSQVNQAAKWSVLPNRKFPILFQVTHGITEREAQSNSSLNKLEAQVLCWYVKSLLEDGLGGDIKVQQEEIGVVTPYLGQCRLLKLMLRQRGHHKVEVGSVESYQGREKLIIIVSLVSSFKHPYFLSNPRRINVFLSRAKSLMILIGNPISLGQNKDFEFIIGQCKLQGNFLTKKKTAKSKSKKTAKSKSKKTVKSQSNELCKTNLPTVQLQEEEIDDQQDNQDEAGEVVLLDLQNQLNELNICEASTG
ncbi:putative helicase MOV-10 [Drosophila montana]|uniref:putative helicase MOV-10 n=1 Tax=Drosophila montana TaxID=40370 RepID=UPI00313CA1C9